MVAVNSTMLPLGTPAPPFELPDPDGRVWRLEDLAAGKPTVVVFLSNHCPFVHHIAAELGEVSARLMAAGAAVVGVMSNDVENHPDDAPGHMARCATEWGWAFPYLYDEDQAVATAYRAACTPDFFVFDAAGRLAYRGQFDDSRPGNDVEVTGADLEAAVEALLSGSRPADEQRPSIGCNIKWKPGAEPEWFG
jgi:peroxiredoxin